jgi:hypothetical protein
MTVKRSLSSGAKDNIKISDRDQNNPNLPNQYAKIKNDVEEEIQVDLLLKLNSIGIWKICRTSIVIFCICINDLLIKLVCNLIRE